MLSCFNSYLSIKNLFIEEGIMPIAGEIQKLDCERCRKQTTHVFTEKEIDPLLCGDSEHEIGLLSLLIVKELGLASVYIEQGWKCTGCQAETVVKLTKKGE